MKIIAKTTFAITISGKSTYLEPGSLIDVPSDEAESLLERELATLPELPAKSAKPKETAE